MTERLDLPRRYREQIEALLREHVPGVEVWAYGSRVNGRSHEGSDLDLVLRGPDLKRIDSGQLMDLTEALEESNVPIIVQVHDWARLPERFHREIERKYVVLVAGGEDSYDTWQKSTIGEIAEVIGGSTPSTSNKENFGGHIPWLTPKDLSGPHNRYISRGYRNLSQQGLASCSAQLLPADAVMISTRAPIGYVAIAKNPIATNQGFRSLVLRENIMVPEFVYYWLTGNVETLERHASGSTFKEISGTALKSIRIPIPPLSEQRTIAHILGTLDDKIELNRRMNETLEEMARALFKSWFVDFDPVRAKMEGRDTGLPPDVADLFPDRLVESKLGKIPEGWEVKTLGDLCHKPQYGYTASAKDKHVGPKFLRITDINKQAWIDWDSVPYCEITEENFDKYRLYKGDVLIARMADPGHGVMIEESQEVVFASYLIRFCPIHERHTRLLQYWLRSDGYWKLVSERGAGTTRASLNAKVLSEFPLVVPSVSVADAFEGQIASLRARVIVNASESRTLTALRDTLLPKLVAGELRMAHKFYGPYT